MKAPGDPKVELPASWLEDSLKPHLLKQAVVYHSVRERQGTHSCLSRNAVSGTGRKAYKQKGTGRARMGSGKAPHRRGGGVAHGPKPRSYEIKMNKKERKQILRAALVACAESKKLHLIDDVSPASHKTKDFVGWLKEQQTPRALIVVDNPSKNLLRASANLPGVELIVPARLNVVKLMQHPHLIISRKAMEILQERLAA